MGALEIFLKAPSSGRSREGEKYKASEKTLFYGIKIDAIVRFGFWRRHQNWCHSDENLFCFSFLAPKRSQTPGALSNLAPNRSQFLAKSPPTPLPQPSGLQNDINFEISWNNLLSVLFARIGSLYLLDLSIPLQ